MKVNEPQRQKLTPTNSWQKAEYMLLYSDLLLSSEEGTSMSAYALPQRGTSNERVASRENGLLTDVRSDRSVAATTCLGRFFCLTCLRSTCPPWWARFHRQEMILNCRVETAVGRVLCFVCSCRLADRGVSVRTRRHVYNKLLTSIA